MGKDFQSAAHSASYAGLASVTRQSGTSIRGEAPSTRVATKSSNECCSSRRLRRSKTTPPRGPTTTRNALKANATAKPSSPSPDADPTSYLPCSETAPSMNRGQPNWPQPLDKNDRSTPQRTGNDHTNTGWFPSPTIPARLPSTISKRHPTRLCR